MKITMDRLQQIIQEEVDVYLLREKLKGKKKTRKKSLETKGDKRSEAEDDELENLKHQ